MIPSAIAVGIACVLLDLARAAAVCGLVVMIAAWRRR